MEDCNFSQKPLAKSSDKSQVSIYLVLTVANCPFLFKELIHRNSFFGNVIVFYSGFLSTQSKYWFLKFNAVLEMENQVYCKVLSFSIQVCMHVGMSLLQSKVMERCGIYYTSDDGSALLLLLLTMRTMTEHTDIYLPLPLLLFSCICLPGNFFQIKKRCNFKGANASDIPLFKNFPPHV